MAKLANFIDTPTRQLSIDELLAEIEAGESQDGLCLQRDWCLVERLGVRPESVASGYRCGFEERHCLWQCHVSGVERNGREKGKA